MDKNQQLVANVEKMGSQIGALNAGISELKYALAADRAIFDRAMDNMRVVHNNCQNIEVALQTLVSMGLPGAEMPLRDIEAACYRIRQVTNRYV